MADDSAFIEYPDSVVIRVDAKPLSGGRSQVKVRKVIPSDEFQCLYRTVVYGQWSDVYYNIASALVNGMLHYSDLAPLAYIYGGTVPSNVVPVKPPAHIVN